MLRGNESGYTIVELLVVLVILGILSGLGYTAFNVYKDDAEYAKAESTLRSARTALAAGELDVNDAFSLGLTLTDSAGGAVPAAISPILPGATVPKAVRLGVMHNSCVGAGDGDIQSFIASQPCRSDRQTYYVKFCGGTDLLFSDAVFGGC